MALQRCKAVFRFWLYAVGPADNGLCNRREANNLKDLKDFAMPQASRRNLIFLANI